MKLQNVYAELERSLDWAKLDHVIALNHLPVAKRHNAKIDYVGLENEIRKRISSHAKL